MSKFHHLFVDVLTTKAVAIKIARAIALAIGVQYLLKSASETVSNA
ncbi:hypothetical protein [Nostoc sp.]